jgi:cell division protein ZapB
MDDRLDTLESKVEQVLALCQSLRSENHTLRNRVAGLEGENHQLTDKISTARRRLEALMTRLPEA